MFLLRIPRFLFGIIVLLLFACTMPIFFVLYVIIFNFLPKQQAPHAAHRLTRVWAYVTLAIMLIRCKVKGREKIDTKKVFVFVGNHQSQLDIPVFAAACSNTFRFLSKAELTKIPVFGYLLKRLYITVDRKDKNDRSKSIALMKRSLEQGISVFLCPEGTRNRTDEPLIEFKDGAFRLAIEAQVPVAVLTVMDSKKRNSPQSQLELIPGTIHCVWDDPIETKGMTIDDVPLLKEKVVQLMLGHLKSGK
jgi:1-acyl-sn-glycerol-3-phosphate acyltransferase